MELSIGGNREIKKHVKDWNPAAFAVEAQQLYIDMNKAYLSDNKAKLATLVTMPMFDKLKALIEHQKNVKFVWKFEGEVEKPKLVYTRLSKAQFDAEDVNKTHMIVQCTVRVHTKQCILVYNNNKLINKENKIRTVLEHIIIERIISIPGSKWQIAGKADLLKIEDNEKYKKKI
ncbi:39S ribosomal protein L45, mitochondrial [Lobulomyces angularis]|nr:39S ribosomal protein L45, mitochondrial [Lobulomyces angularis]